MIGVISTPMQARVVEEFFELFKTPWEAYRPGQQYDVIITATTEVPETGAKLIVSYGSDCKPSDSKLGVAVARRHEETKIVSGQGDLPIYGKIASFQRSETAKTRGSINSEPVVIEFTVQHCTIIRVGFDLFDEVRHLLIEGQPSERASIPTLEIHIAMLRNWIVSCGIPLVEIPAIPANSDFAVCLTHDIDFIGVRRHFFDHSMWGFVFRATAGSLRNFIRRRLSFKRLVQNWLATASLPFVYAGWLNDFWEPFKWYIGVEKGLGATYYFIPFKRRAGDRVPGRFAARRATAYDVGDIQDQIQELSQLGCELGVHGLDAWHNAERGRTELARVTSITHDENNGIRMHWLLNSEETPSILEKAGYAYDSTFGYNDTVGFRGGTTQVFRPLSTQRLLELPLHIQDGALFFPYYMNLSEKQAQTRCQAVIDCAVKYGGVVTLLWHDRSHGPERFWGDFYVKLVENLKSMNCWFGTAAQIVAWFRKRRDVQFVVRQGQSGPAVAVRYSGEAIDPPLRVRVHMPRNGRTDVPADDFLDILWTGESNTELENQLDRLQSAFTAA